MPLSAEEREQVAAELKKFATDLDLSEYQEGKLHGFLAEAYEKAQEYKTKYPNASKEDLIKRMADNRGAIRERLIGFLTPEQLTKWDSAITKAKEFLGHKMAASA